MAGRLQTDCVYCLGPQREHPWLPPSLQTGSTQTLQNKSTNPGQRCFKWSRMSASVLPAGLTWFVPVISGAVAERLAAEQVVTLKMTTHAFQEAQHEGSTGGWRQSDHPNAAVCSHWNDRRTRWAQPDPAQTTAFPSPASTSDDLSSAGVRLQGAEQHFRLVRAVDARLDHLLEHAVHWTRAKVVRQMLHLLPVQVGAAVSMLVHIHTHWTDTQNHSKSDIWKCNTTQTLMTSMLPVDTTEPWLGGLSCGIWMLGNDDGLWGNLDFLYKQRSKSNIPLHQKSDLLTNAGMRFIFNAIHESWPVINYSN